MKFVFLFLSIFATLAILQKLNASNMILNWNPSISPNVIGYDVYYETIGGNSLYSVRAGNVTSVTISNLTAGATYYFAATAYTSSGDESALSAAIMASVPPNVASTPRPATNPGRAGSTTSNRNGGATSGQGSAIPPGRSSSTTSGRPGVASRPEASIYGSVVSAARSVAASPRALLQPASARIAVADVAAASAVESAFAQVVHLTVTQTSDAPALASVRFSVEQGHSYQVQATIDFRNWISVWRSDVASSNGWAQFTDPDSKSYHSRFYRLVSY